MTTLCCICVSVPGNKFWSLLSREKHRRAIVNTWINVTRILVEVPICSSEADYHFRHWNNAVGRGIHIELPLMCADQCGESGTLNEIFFVHGSWLLAFNY